MKKKIEIDLKTRILGKVVFILTFWVFEVL